MGAAASQPEPQTSTNQNAEIQTLLMLQIAKMLKPDDQVDSGRLGRTRSFASQDEIGLGSGASKYRLTKSSVSNVLVADHARADATKIQMKMSLSTRFFTRFSRYNLEETRESHLKSIRLAVGAAKRAIDTRRQSECDEDFAHGWPMRGEDNRPCCHLPRLDPARLQSPGRSRGCHLNCKRRRNDCIKRVH